MQRVLTNLNFAMMSIAAAFYVTQLAYSMEFKDYYQSGSRVCSASLNSVGSAQDEAKRLDNLNEFDASQIGSKISYISNDTKMMIIVRSRGLPNDVADSCSFYIGCDGDCKYPHFSDSNFLTPTYDQKCKLVRLDSNSLPEFKDAQLVLQTMGSKFKNHKMTCVLYN
jgi:hypothetical protein